MLGAMYAAHFGLNESAFSIAPDPRFLFMSGSHREAMAHLVYGLQAGGGIVLLTGEVGAGKTTLCRAFLGQLPAGCHVAYLYNPQLSRQELLQAINEEFGAGPAPAGQGLKALVDTLQRHLLAVHGRGEQCLLVVDEAQGLDAKRLELLRLLTNLETSQRKLLQVMLVGQPELAQRLAEPALRQLEQRIVARSHLAALSPDETADLVRHRLAVAGLTGACPFDAAALRAVHRASDGIPRRVNRVCERAMLAAYAAGRSRIDAALVRQAADEVTRGAGAPPRSALRLRRPSTPALAAGTMGAALATVAGLLAWPPGPRSDSPEGTVVAAPAAVAEPAARPTVVPGEGPARLPDSPPSASSPGAPTPSTAMHVDPVDAFESFDAGWSALRDLWVEDSPPGDCTPGDSMTVGLACHRGLADLELLRRLDRPVLLELEPQGWLLLLGMGSERLTVRGRLGEADLAPQALHAAWAGRFVTLWRLPPGKADRTAGHDGAWVHDRLSALQGPLHGALARQPRDAQLRQRVFAFQHSQGLPLDAVAGPLTLMQLNRASGVKEPRLRPAP